MIINVVPKYTYLKIPKLKIWINSLVNNNKTGWACLANHSVYYYSFPKKEDTAVTRNRVCREL